MRNFKQIHLESLPSLTKLLQEELGRNEEFWYADQSRQKKIKVQQNTQSIFLRGAVCESNALSNKNEVQASAETKYAKEFPATMAALAAIADLLKGELSRALYTRLLPQSRVYRHIDEGSYYALRDRYHLVINSPGGSILICEDEQLTLYEGQLWWFNNHLPHESMNCSTLWRTHLIFDLLPVHGPIGPVGV
jgi:Aspartyl/Asparaginyl beta-hydroxylase